MEKPKNISAEVWAKLNRIEDDRKELMEKHGIMKVKTGDDKPEEKTLSEIALGQLESARNALREALKITGANKYKTLSERQKSVSETDNTSEKDNGNMDNANFDEDLLKQLETLAKLDITYDRTSTTQRLDMLEELKKQDPKIFLPKLFTILDYLLKEISDTNEENNKKVFALIKEISGIIKNVIHLYSLVKGKETSRFTAHRESYKEVPDILKKNLYSNNANGMELIIQMLIKGDRFLKERVARDILAPLVDKFYTVLIPLRIDRKKCAIGKYIKIALESFKTITHEKLTEKKELTKEEQAALNAIENMYIRE